MTSAKRKSPFRTSLLAAVSLLAAAQHAGAADQASHQPDWYQQLAAARASYYAAIEGNRAADAEAQQQFADLVREHPHEATLQAYAGSLELLQASHTWSLGQKHALSVGGIAEMDAAVNADPNNLEARFVRALTTWHLPFIFHRKEQAEEDLLFLGPRSEQAVRTGALPPKLAAAALDYYGQVLDERKERDAARGAYEAAVRVDRSSPAASDALKRLH